MFINGSISVQMMISFIVFLIFFGWVGLRRGAKRELIVLIVSVTTWLLLQERGDLLVSITNLGGKLLTTIASGGLSADGTVTAGGDIQPWITDANRNGFLFFVWVIIVLITYLLTNKFIKDKDSKSDGWAILWGIANGLFFASIFLPRLILLFAPTQTSPQQASQQLAEEGRGSIISFLNTGFQMISDAISSFWAGLGGLQPYVLLGLLTLFLILVYSSIRGAKIANLGGSGKSKC
jgi:hypothetical protein